MSEAIPTKATEPDDATVLDQVLAELRTVKEQLATLQRQVDVVPAPSATPAGAHVRATAVDDVDVDAVTTADGIAVAGRRSAPMSRRAVMAAAAGLTATGVVAVAGASPAAAANGNPVLAGNETTATATTTLTSSVAGNAAFAAQNPSTSPSTGIYARSAGYSGFGQYAAVVGDSDDRTGVAGLSANTNGVLGRSVQGDGVLGISTLGGGVTGIASNSLSPAVQGQHQGTSGTGVYGSCSGGKALEGFSSSGWGAQLYGGRAQLFLHVQGTRAAPTLDTTAHSSGELVRDSAGVLWYCTTGGTPGTWRRLAGPGSAGAFHVLPTPARIYDSRPGTAPAAGPKTPLSGNTSRLLYTNYNGSGVPNDATAVSVTVLLVNAANVNGNFTMWAGDAAKPASNTMVWGAGSGRYTGFAISALGSNATIQVAASATTDVVLDVVGYYR